MKGMEEQQDEQKNDGEKNEGKQARHIMEKARAQEKRKKSYENTKQKYEV